MNIIKYDKYGFIRDDVNDNTEEGKDEKIENLNIEKKWVSTLFSDNRVEVWSTDKLLSKGIPSSLRGLVWRELLKIEELKLKYERIVTYKELLNKKEQLNQNTKRCIEIDLKRIFPTHFYFNDSSTIGGQQSLFNILSAYAIYNPNIGYVSGMMYIPSLLLIYMCEEDAFWGLFQIIEKYGMDKMWSGNFAQHLTKCTGTLNSLLVTLFPKLVKHFQGIEIDLITITASWFLTLFIYCLPIQYIVRIWDLYLNEDFVVIFAVGCTLFKIYENKLLSSDFSEIISTFSKLNQGIYENNNLILKVDVSKFIDLVVYYKSKIGNINNTQ